MGGASGVRRAAGAWTMAAVAAAVMWSCGGGADGEESGLPADILYRVGDATLTASQVVAQIPSGLAPADSAALFERIADDWLYSTLLERDATLGLDDREQIEASVRRYRRRLTAERYRERLAANGADAMTEDSVRRYYDTHREEFILRSPLVKGALLTLPSSSPRLAEARRWLRTPSDRTLSPGQLEAALQYEIFLDQWMDWKEVSALLPRHGASGPPPPGSTAEYASGGALTLLAVTELAPAGDVAPFERAAPAIREMMLRRQADRTERALLRTLREQALKAGTMTDYRQSSRTPISSS